MMFLLLFLLMNINVTPGVCGSELSVPSDVRVKVDAVSQTLMVSWFSNCSLFHIQIYYTDLNQLIYNERVLVGADPQSGSHSWFWFSELPLQCTSHSVRLRALHHNSVSQWSPLVTSRGQDVPAYPQTYMFPQDKVLLVGSNLTVCCIEPVDHNVGFQSIWFMDQVLESHRLSHRTYTSTITHLQPSGPSGTNIICNSNISILTGTAIFIGYPPGDEGLQCETRDLKTADCQWSKGRDTNLRRLIYLTKYTLNTRNCTALRRETSCRLDEWADTFTLVARNPLGLVQLNDSAPMLHRVRPLAPVNMTLAVKAWQAVVGWSWTVEAYRTLEMVCQVELNSRGRTDTRNYTGVGLSSVILNRLKPDSEYRLSIRCATLQPFWRWGDWSAPYSLHTEMDRPEAVDVWVWRSSENTAYVVWKPLSVSDSHGALQLYEVWFETTEERVMLNISVPVTVFNIPLQLNQTADDLIVSVAAQNPVGLSQFSKITITPFISDSEVPVSELVGGRGGVSVSWSGGDRSSTGYVIEWRPTCSSAPSSVQWEKVSSSNTSFIIHSDALSAGVRYTISVFSLRPDSIALLQRHHAYIQELGPSVMVDRLLAHQSGSDVILSWNSVKVCDQSSFLRGYSIYRNHGLNISLIERVPDPTLTQYRVKGLVLGTYKFMVSWFSSAGESSTSTITIRTESANLIMVEILVALGIMSLCLFIIIIFCYKKREWVKKAFYPEIPGPKLTGDWTVPTAPLDMKPSPHSLVHIVESPDNEVLVTELEDADGGRGHGEEEELELEAESDEPGLLRYYNQLVSDTSGFSSSSADSVDTQVTYADIQSPAYRPQTQPPAPPTNHALQQEVQQEESTETAGGGGGYKPQCTWRSTSPEPDHLSVSLGSPTSITSITSTQFLLPETEEHTPTPPTTWLHSLLSGKF